MCTRPGYLFLNEVFLDGNFTARISQLNLVLQSFNVILFEEIISKTTPGLNDLMI